MRLVIAALAPIVWLFCRVFFRVRFHGVENIPPEGACIIAPNHVTYADPIWITIPVRRRIYYMAWDKPFQIPLLGFLMRLFGAFPLNLDNIDPSAHRAARELLLKGRALVVFPEGGRARTEKLEPFKLGAFRLALAHGVKVVPVSIRGAHDIWPVGRMFPGTGRLTITYHPPIEVERVSDDITKAELRILARELAHKTRRIIATALDAECLPEEEEEESERQKVKGENVSETV
ncbi:MAG: lysophospholipid acyltransferase family protein [Acidobacteriota bacterium]